MTHKETIAAIRLSLLLADDRAIRHGVYAHRRPPISPPVEPPLAPCLMSIHHTIVPDQRDDTGFSEARW